MNLDTVLEIFIDGKDISVDLDAYIPVSEDISAEFADQASRYAYIAMLAARAEAAYMESKTELKRVYAETDKEVRQDLASIGGKSTEAMVSVEIELRRGYKEAKDYEQYYYQQHLIMKAIETAMKMRADMLVSLGAQLRNEAQQLGMSVKSQVMNIRARQAV